MGKLGGHNGEGLVKHNDPDRGSNQKNTGKGKEKADQALKGMVPVRCSGIHLMIGMMNQVDHPEWFYLVFHIMGQVGANQVEQQYPKQHIKPKGHLRQPVYDTKAFVHYPVTGIEQ